MVICRTDAYKPHANEKEGVGQTVVGMFKCVAAGGAEHLPKPETTGKGKGQVRHDIAEVWDAEP